MRCKALPCHLDSLCCVVAWWSSGGMAYDFDQTGQKVGRDFWLSDRECQVLSLLERLHITYISWSEEWKI